jgi:uncharacterized RDD family membrane protein YckC
MNEPVTQIIYAGFWTRFLAAMLDIIVQSAVLIPILIYLFGINALIAPDHDWGYSNWIINAISCAVIILFWKYKSATPGKMIMGLKLVDADSFQTPPTGRLILRLFAYYVSILPLCLGFLWIAFDKRKQGFHDKIARTVVVWGR